jgi:hypothetical protein
MSKKGEPGVKEEPKKPIEKAPGYKGKKRGRKPVWTPKKLAELARLHAPGCFTHLQFYRAIGLSFFVFYKCLTNPEFNEFNTIIKKEIDDAREPTFRGLADSVLITSLQNGLNAAADDKSKDRALTAAMLVQNTIGGWKAREQPKAKSEDDGTTKIRRIVFVDAERPPPAVPVPTPVKPGE